MCFRADAWTTADHDGDDAWCDGIAHAAAAAAGPAAGRRGRLSRGRGARAVRGSRRAARAERRRRVRVARRRADHARFKRDRTDVHDGTTTLRAVVERERLRLALDTLVLFAHWVTPPIDTRQFDTRFFMTRVPPHQTPAHDDTETTHSIWMTPADAIAQSQRGEIVLPPPTWSTLRELEPFASVDDALAWARRRRVVRRQPRCSSRTASACCCCPAIRCIRTRRRRTARRNALRVRRPPLARRAGDPNDRPTSSTTPQLRRVLGFRDLFLFYVVTGFSLRWIATAAAAGPSALVIWVIAALGFFVPLVFTDAGAVVALSGGRRHLRLEQARVRAVRGVHHRLDVLGLEPAVFPGAAVLRRRPTRSSSAGRRGSRSSSNSTYFIAVASIGLTLAVTMNVVGLNVGKWLNNVGALAGWIVGGAADRARRRSRGAASDRRRRSTRSALVPSTSLKDVIFWSTIAFAFGGVESGSTMGEEIQDARRTVPRAILAAGARHHGALHRRDAERPARDPEGAGVRTAGDHAGDSGDDGEGRLCRGWRRSSPRS